MINESIEIDKDIYEQIEKIFMEFCKEMTELGKEQAAIRKYGIEGIPRYDTMNFVFNWKEYYDVYKNRCKAICTNENMLANIAVILSYEKHPNKNKKFIWIVADNGVLENLKQAEIQLPILNKYGSYEYLGKRYSMKQMDCLEMEEYLIDK